MIQDMKGRQRGKKNSWLTDFLCSLMIFFSDLFSVRIGKGDNSQLQCCGGAAPQCYRKDGQGRRKKG